MQQQQRDDSAETNYKCSSVVASSSKQLIAACLFAPHLLLLRCLKGHAVLLKYLRQDLLLGDGNVGGGVGIVITAATAPPGGVGVAVVKV